MGVGSYITSQMHDQTEGVNKTWQREGTISYDSTIYGLATPSIRMTPNSATNVLRFPPGKKLVLKAKDTLTASPSIKLRKSNTTSADSFANDASTYNGNAPKFVALRNAAVGLTETTIATATAASAGAKETLSGATSGKATDNGGFEVDILIDGTAGWVNIDDIDCTYA